MDDHLWQQLWLHRNAYFACNHGGKKILNHRKIVYALPLAKSVDLRNEPINIIRHLGKVTRLQSSHFKVLQSVISILHSTWCPVHNQPHPQSKDFQVMGHCGDVMMSTMVGMWGLKCSPLHRFRNKGCHLQVHRECLKNHQKAIQSISQNHPVHILHLNLLSAHLQHPQLASQWSHSSSLRNRRNRHCSEWGVASHASDFLRW